MNLIEQLGGYDLASSFFIESNGAEWNGVFHMGTLGKALLEHRRQHNIFEVGDWVYPVAKGSSFGAIQITEKGESLIYSDHLILNMHHWRHATDAEIKAGKRLEVKSEN